MGRTQIHVGHNRVLIPTAIRWVVDFPSSDGGLVQLESQQAKSVNTEKKQKMQNNKKKEEPQPLRQIWVEKRKHRQGIADSFRAMRPYMRKIPERRAKGVKSNACWETT